MLYNKPGENGHGGHNELDEYGLEYGADAAGGVVAVHPSGTSGIPPSKTT